MSYTKIGSFPTQWILTRAVKGNCIETPTSPCRVANDCVHGLDLITDNITYLRKKAPYSRKQESRQRGGCFTPQQKLVHSSVAAVAARVPS